MAATRRDGIRNGRVRHVQDAWGSAGDDVESRVTPPATLTVAEARPILYRWDGTPLVRRIGYRPDPGPLAASGGNQGHAPEES